MELKDAIFTTLQFFVVLMIIILTVSYISFKIKKKKSGELEPYQKTEEKPATPKLAIKTASKTNTNEKSKDQDTSKPLSLEEIRQKEQEKLKERQKEKANQKERQKEKKRKEEQERKSNKDKHTSKNNIQSRSKDSREDERKKESNKSSRFQVLNTTNDEEDLSTKSYSRPVSGFTIKENKNEKIDKNKSDDILNRYTDEDEDDFFSPKIPTKGK